MAKKSGFARAAEALAIGIGAGMEGYGKGTMASLVEQRRAALEEIRDRRAAQQALEEREWRTQESEKTREFQRETAAESMAWEKEKFGMEQAADEARTNRTLAAQERLAKLRGAGGGKEPPAEIQKIKYLAGIIASQEGSKEVTPAHERQAFDLLNAKEGRDTTTPFEREAEAVERTRALAEGRQPTPKGLARAMEELRNIGEFEPKTATSSMTALQYNRAFLDTLEMIVPTGKTPTAKDRAEARRILAEQNMHPPGGSTEAVPGPTPPPESVAPSQAEQAPPKEIGGDGTREKPFEATSLEELDELLNSNDPGVWIRYKNKKYQVK